MNYLKLKRVMDIILSVLAILPLAPLFLLIVVIIRLDSEGQAVFKQKRIGQGKETFYIYKFRTMKKRCEP